MAAFHLPAQAGASVDQRLQDEPEGASGCLLACEQVLEELPPDRRGGPPGLVVRDDLAAQPGLVLGAAGTLARPGLALQVPVAARIGAVETDVPGLDRPAAVLDGGGIAGTGRMR